MALIVYFGSDSAQGTVLLFKRGDRIPAQDFLDNLTERDKKKFYGNFGAFVELGPRYRNLVRFKPLRDKGKPLWEFKEHDHRLYCLRRQVGDHAYVVLLCGWTKDKAGKHPQEARSIQRAQSLRNEVEADFTKWLHRTRKGRDNA